MQVINEDMEVCPPSVGAVAGCLLELFERVTGELFSETPGMLVTNRVRAISKVMGNLVREVQFEPPLLQAQQRAYVCWNRCPKVRVDWQAWRRREEAAEEFRAPVPRARGARASVDATLAAWMREHRYLSAADISAGESGMALLILWEIDHDMPFPTQGDGRDRAAVLTGFTKRLQARVKKDDVLSAWVTWKDVQAPLSPGLEDSHHCRWSVRVRPPRGDEPQGWYEEFIRRWRAYLETQAAPRSRPVPSPALPAPAPDTATPMAVDAMAHATSSAATAYRPASASLSDPALPPVQPATPVGEAQPTPAAPARPHPKRTAKKRCRSASASPSSAPVSAASPAAASGGTTTNDLGPHTQRQPSLLHWLRPRGPAGATPDPMPPATVPPTRQAEHGRAVQGPPT